MEAFSALLAICAGNSRVPHRGQCHGALMSYLICAWINGWVNNSEAGDLRRHRAHYDVIVTKSIPRWPDSFQSVHFFRNSCTPLHRKIIYGYLLCDSMDIEGRYLISASNDFTIDDSISNLYWNYYNSITRIQLYGLKTYSSPLLFKYSKIDLRCFPFHYTPCVTYLFCTWHSQMHLWHIYLTV